MKIRNLANRIALVAAAGLFAPSALADPASDAAYRLLDSVRMQDAMSQSINNMLEIQLQQNPALAPYRQVMREFFHEYLSYDAVKHDIAAIYIESFTAEEMNVLADFNETEIGQKAVRLMPELMARGAQLGAARVQENQEVLAERIRQESERLQQLSEQQP